jgi:hypothetical protein
VGQGLREVERLQRKPELRDRARIVELATSELLDPTNAVDERLLVYEELTRRPLPRSVAPQECPKRAHEVRRVLFVVVEERSENLSGNSLRFP